MYASPAPEAFDEAWYGRAYPAAKLDVEIGLATDLADHYRRLGRFRGYLPNVAAERPDHAAAYRGGFGGLWIDLANAQDILHGKLETGAISERQHGMLRDFMRDGYLVLPGAVPQQTLAAAREDLERAYAGEDPEQQFHCEARANPFSPWTPEVRDHPAKAVEMHWRCRAMRDAAFAPAISEFLALIFERRALISQSLGFYRGSGQAPHQDSAYVAYSLYLQFAASWIALEDVTAGAGELCYYPGSHAAFPDHLFLGRHKVAFEASRRKSADEEPPNTADYEASLPKLAEQNGLPLQTFLAKAGDALIWAANLAHGGMPISTAATRKSVVTHYCPREVAPAYFEHMQTGRELHRHESGNYYATWA